MAVFAQCKNVRVTDVSLLNSPFWTLQFADCDAVNADGIRLWSGMLVPNADGSDVTSSSNVTIENSDIRTGNDALAIVGTITTSKSPASAASSTLAKASTSVTATCSRTPVASASGC